MEWLFAHVCVPIEQGMISRTTIHRSWLVAACLWSNRCLMWQTVMRQKYTSHSNLGYVHISTQVKLQLHLFAKLFLQSAVFWHRDTRCHYTRRMYPWKSQVCLEFLKRSLPIKDSTYLTKGYKGLLIVTAGQQALRLYRADNWTSKQHHGISPTDS